MKNFLKIFSKFFIVLSLAFAAISAMFYTDSGRETLLKAVSTYFESKDIVFRINGLDRNITKIQEIFIRFPDGIELIFSDVSLERKGLISKSDIYVQKFVLNGTENKINLDEKLKSLIPLMRMLRFFISNLSLGQGFLRIGGETYFLNDLKYATDLPMNDKPAYQKDRLYSKINQKFVLDVDFIWDGITSVRSDISFKNILNLDGVLTVFTPEKNTSEYKFNAKNDRIKITSCGDYKSFMHDIAISSAAVEYGKKSYSISGNLYISDKKAYIKSKIDLENLFKLTAYPSQISKNFRDVNALCSVLYDLNKDAISTAEISFFQKAENKIGKLKCTLKNEKLKIFGDIGWINIYGFAFKNLECNIDKFKTVDLCIKGENFEAKSSAKIGKFISVQNFEIKSEKGVVKASHPFDLKKDIDCSFDFNFSQLDFWNKIIPVSGSGYGSFSYRNGNILAIGDFKKIFIKNCGFLDLYMSIDKKNIKIKSKNANISDAKLKNLDLKIENGKIEVTSILNNNFSLSALGKISESYEKISMENFFIKSSRTNLELKTCDLNFSDIDYKLYGVLSDKNEKNLGNFKINYNKDGIDLNIASLHAKEFFKLINKNFWSGVISGDLKLKQLGKAFIGFGDFSIASLVSSRNSVSLKCNALNDGLKITANLKSRADKMEANLFLPIVFTADWNIEKNIHSNLLNCRILGNISLENLLELSDKIDLRGNLDCNLYVRGSLASPSLTGEVNLQKALFSANDILLKSGTISLIGQGKRVIVKKAEFIDYKNKRAEVTGDGTVFFDGLIPNIKTNLQLNFDNFTLFDSDSLNIAILGKGAITGPLNNMLISGDVKIPSCKLQHFNTANANGNDEIVIENEINIEKNRNRHSSSKKDFFRYDINMHCPNINCIGTVFDMTLFGDIKLETFEDQATLSGVLNLSKGRLNLFGKRMNFTKGNVIFFKENPFDPKSFFRCNRNFGDLSVYLEIKSSPKKGFSFNLFSTPNYTEDVILSKMLFGKELRHLSVSEAAQLAHAITSFNQRSGYIFSVLNTFQKFGFVDTISFAGGDESEPSRLYSDTQSSQNKNKVSLRAGKYINDNVFISVNKDSEGASFDVDLSVTPQVSVKASTKGEAGVSWKFRY